MMRWCAPIFIVCCMEIGFVSGRYDTNETTIMVLEGQTVKLPCNTTPENEGDKMTVLKWYKEGAKTAFHSRDLRNEVAMPSPDTVPSRYQLTLADDGTSGLYIKNAREEDSGTYRCHADFDDSRTTKTFITLLVIVPPHRLFVGHMNGTQLAWTDAGNNVTKTINPYLGDTLNLYCVVIGGKPRPKITWSSKDTELKNTFTPLSKDRIRSDMIVGPLTREHHATSLTCSGNNNPTTEPLSVRLDIDMFLPPELIIVRTKEQATRVRAGEPLTLQCRVLGANPPPQHVVWKINDGQLFNVEQKITVSSSRRLVVSEVQVTLGESQEEARAECCSDAGRSDNAFLCSEPLPIVVTHSPRLAIQTESEAVNGTVLVKKGQPFSMNCSFVANPEVFELLWYKEDTVITEQTENEGYLIHYTLNIADVDESDAGEYYCAASNEEGPSTSEPIVLDVVYPPTCEDLTISNYGLAAEDEYNFTCIMKANPPTTMYRWLIVNEALERDALSTITPNMFQQTTDNVFTYRRPNHTANSTIICVGVNSESITESSVGASDVALAGQWCAWRVSDRTVPRPPRRCRADRRTVEIRVECEKGYDGGSTQEFTLTIRDVDTDQQIISITKPEPLFAVQEPKLENFKLVIVATNSKGSSEAVEISKDDIEFVGERSLSATLDIWTLSMCLCGGVLLLVLAACGLALCDHAAHSAAAHTDESVCETCNSDDDNNYHLHRTESFRRAISRCPSRNMEVRRTSSFHSPRCLNDDSEPIAAKEVRRPSGCRVHSMQNISRKREIDALCERLHMPIDPRYSLPRQSNSFYTIPRKLRQKSARDDDISDTQNSDGLSLPPPPDEFNASYRLGTRIKELPTKTMPTYSTVRKFNRDTPQLGNTNVSQINTVGLPTISGNQHSIYSYPDENQQDTARTTFSTFKSWSSRIEVHF